MADKLQNISAVLSRPMSLNFEPSSDKSISENIENNNDNSSLIVGSNEVYGSSAEDTSQIKILLVGNKSCAQEGGGTTPNSPNVQIHFSSKAATQGSLSSKSAKTKAMTFSPDKG